MKMQSDLQGRLRNTTLANSAGLTPLYECVVNSLQAIEERGAGVEGRVEVHVVRQGAQGKLDLGRKKRGPEAEGGICGFIVVDNGIGFDEDNMHSFHTLDTVHKSTKGCRGVGRLAWLKAFDSVADESVFLDGESSLKKRAFKFSSKSGVFDERIEPACAGDAVGARVHLDGFKDQYRKASLRKSRAIGQSIVEHCLWYFLRDGGVPDMQIIDEGVSLSLNDLFDEIMLKGSFSEKISIKGSDFEILHVKLRSNSIGAHSMALCAANRVMAAEKLAGKIHGLHGRLADAEDVYFYSCYVSSPVLDGACWPERNGFWLPEKCSELLADEEISLEDIRAGVFERVRRFLSDQLERNVGFSRDRVESFVNTKSPRYRPILSKVPVGSIDPDISDKDLELALHRYLVDIERDVIEEGHEILSAGGNESPGEYRDRVASYLEKVEDIKKSDLAGYVSHRRVVLDIFESAICRLEDGRYAKEDLIHGLIMPMRKESRDVVTEACNLWMIDERLAFHDYLASDKAISSMPITDSLSTKEPDLIALNVFDNPLLVGEAKSMPLASLVVVEFKRPMRNDAKSGEVDDPIEQALGYLDRVREGKVRTRSGRPISRSEDIPGYCYVICDITPAIEKRCKVHDLTRTADGLGYFSYKSAYKAYVEVISYDGILKSARERNRAFFDKLGLPS